MVSEPLGSDTLKNHECSLELSFKKFVPKMLLYLLCQLLIYLLVKVKPLLPQGHLAPGEPLVVRE